MHESSLLVDLIDKINTVAKDNNSNKVTSVKIKLGALSHISAEHFREHFIRAVKGTVAESARLDIDISMDETDPGAQDIFLDSVEVA